MYHMRFRNCGLLNTPLIIKQEKSKLYYLFYIFDGSGFLLIDSSHYLCGKNQLFLFSGFDLALAHARNHSNLLVFYVSFECDSSDICEAFFRQTSHIFAPPIYRDIFIRIFHESGMLRMFYQELCTFYLEEILVPLIINSARNHNKEFSDIPFFAEETAFEGHSLQALLEPVITYIEQQLSENLSPSFLAEKFHINERQLNQLFQKKFHQSTTAYILSRRLAHARELLCFSSYTITEIAEMTGFHSIHYFSQIFKKREGISPNMYRKKLSITQ